MTRTVLVLALLFGSTTIASAQDAPTCAYDLMIRGNACNKGYKALCTKKVRCGWKGVVMTVCQKYTCTGPNLE